MKKIIFFFFMGFLMMGFSQGAQAGTGYKKALKKWTRGDKVYQTSNLEAAIIWKATLLNDEMLRAQARKYADQYDLQRGEQDIYLQELRSKREGEVLFFISFYSGNFRFADLTNKRAHWDLRLEIGSERFEPTHIEKIEKPTPLHHMFYPYIMPWSKGYYVWFPAEAATLGRPWSLTVHGPDAASELKWK